IRRGDLVRRLLCVARGLRRIDPGRGGRLGRTRRLADEALGVGRVGGGEDPAAGVVGGLGLPMVDELWREQADPGVAVLGVVPAEEVPTDSAGLLHRGEALGEAGAVL